MSQEYIEKDSVKLFLEISKKTAVDDTTSDSVDTTYSAAKIEERISEIPSGGVEEAPVDTKQYGRKDAGWTEITAGSSPTVATGAEVDAGTDNTKMVTPKAMEDSAYGKVSDTAYGSGWDGVTTIAPSKNAVYDKIYPMNTDLTWAMGKLTGSGLSDIGGDVVDSEFVVLFEGEWFKISYSDLLAQIQNDLGL